MTDPIRLYADQYLSSAQATALAYVARTLPIGASANDLKLAIKQTSNWNSIFTSQELDNFTNTYQLVGRHFQAIEGSPGLDAVAFRRIGTNEIMLNFAGVNTWADFGQTAYGTVSDAFNRYMVYEGIDFYRSIAAQYPDAIFDLAGHSAGGPVAHLVAAQIKLDGKTSALASVATFGSFIINFKALEGNDLLPTDRQLLQALRELEQARGFVNFSAVHSDLGYRDPVTLGLPPGAPLPVSGRPAGFTYVELFAPEGVANVHSMSFAYIGGLRLLRNNNGPLPFSGVPRPHSEIEKVAERLSVAPEDVFDLARGVVKSDGTVTYVIPTGRLLSEAETDPRTGAPLPHGLRRSPSPIGVGNDVVVDDYNRMVEIHVRLGPDGPIVIGTTTYDAWGPSGAGVKVDIVYSNGRPSNVEITAANAPLGIDFSQLGSIIGSTLGSHLVGGDQIAGLVVSSALQTLGNNLGDALDGVIGGGSVSRSVETAFKAFDDELFSSLTSAGVGTISSYLTAQLVAELGLEGFTGEFANAATSQALTTIVSNILAGAETAEDIFAGIGPQLPFTIAASILGGRLANEIKAFESVGGQIGAQIGSAYGSFVAGVLIKASFATGNPLVVAATVAAATVVVAAYQLIGGLIGSIFGGTPRSGADVTWDAASGQFTVANAYSRKGGSKQAAVAMANSVADTFNAVLAATGGTLLNPEAVQAGNYGMRRKEYVYRPVSSRETEDITKRFSGKTGAQQLIGYGIYQGLQDPDFQIAGGSVYVKRALYNGLSLPGINPDNLDTNIILGDIATARRYETYLASSTSINALISAEPESVFALEWALVLARAVELGLHRRHQADWYGGFGKLLEDAGANATEVAFGLDIDPWSGRPIRRIGLGEYELGDSIDIAGQDIVEGTAGNDTITLSGDSLLATSGAINAGLTFNGAAFEGQTTRIDVAAIIDAGAGDDVVRASDRGDNIFGGAGNDTLIGGKLDDWLIGGEGNDELFAGSVVNGSVTISAAIAADGGSGNYLDGGAGDDKLYGSTGSDWLVGGDGVDELHGGAGGDILNAGKGNEGTGSAPTIQGGAGSDQYIYNRGDGVDIYFDDASGGAPGATVDSISTAAKNRTNGTIAKNWSGGGEFLADGSTKGGDDAIVFGAGIDMRHLILERSGAIGYEGMDLIIKIQREDGTWYEGDDKIVVKDWFEGTRRIEWLRFANGEEIRIGDFVSIQKGTAANDVIIGSNGNDFQYGGDGDDRMWGLQGNDWQVGGKGNDFVSGNDDDDYQLGGDDDDVVLGGIGHDTLFGDDGNDRVYGGQGNDLVIGGRGDDEVAGGAGNDIFRFSRGDGRDTLIDEYAGTWELAWRNGQYQSGSGYSYSVDPNTSIVTRTSANGAEIVGDAKGWYGNFDYNEQGGYKSLYRLVTPPSGPLTKDSGEDVLEFGVGIDIQDLMFEQHGTDLRIAITNSGASVTRFADVADQILIKDWYDEANGVRRSIETFVFVNTGAHQASSMTLRAGTDADDTLAGGSGVDWLTGGAGNDTLTGSGGNDILNGNSGADILSGGIGDDVIYGGDGDDILIGGDGADILIGGSGSDTASYVGDYNGVTVFLDATQGTNSGDAFGDVFESIENLIGTHSGDVLYGDAGDNVIDGERGTDSLFGGAGNDIYIFTTESGSDTIVDRVMVGTSVVAGDGGQDMIEAGPGLSLANLTFSQSDNSLEIKYSSSHKVMVMEFFATTDAQVEDIQFSDGLVVSLVNIKFATSVQTLFGTSGDDFLVGRTSTSSGDTLEGGDGNDVLSGHAGNDILRGGAGDDVLEGGAGADTLDGGVDDQADGGRGDTIRYVTSTAVSINLETKTASGGDAAGDTIVHVNGVSTIENVTGSNDVAVGDVLVGDSRANILSGLDGDDTLIGGGGNDVLLGGAGNDTISGGDGEDNIDAGDGDDTNVSGGNGRDLIVGGGGDDVLYGDGGDDQLDGGVGADILWGGADNDRLSGGEGDDILHGDAGEDVLSGGIGNDVLNGGDGDDTLSGDVGNDTLNGGAGNDSYIFNGASGQDVISDQHGSNRILLTSVSAEQIWMVRVGDDLKVSVIGGDTEINVSGFFAASGGSKINELVTAEASLFLKYAGGLQYAGSLIEAMTLASPTTPASLAAVPAAVSELRNAHWWAGGKPAPRVTDQSVTVPEDGTIGGTLVATDHDENLTGYALDMLAQHGVVSLDTVTGAWTYTPSQNFNGTDRFVISVSDADGQTAKAEFAVTVTPQNDAPVFSANQPTLSVDENSANDTIIGTIAASDIEGDALTFVILDSGSPFLLSPAGVLSVRDGTLLDYEAATTRKVNIRVFDDQGGHADKEFTINLNPVNERPDAPTIQGQAVVRVSESFGGVGPAIGGTAIATLTRNDVDGTTPALRLKSGDTSVFAISGNQLIFKSGFDPNFETLAVLPGAILVDRDGDGRKEIEFTAEVEAWDGALASLNTISLTVGIEDVNEAPTAITLSNGNPNLIERDRPAEGATLSAISLGTLSATDPDLAIAGESFVYSVADSRFEIANGNELRLKAGAALDYESATVDGGTGNRYVDVAVTVKDRAGGTGHLSHTQSIRIWVTDAVDYAYGTAGADAGVNALQGQAGRDIMEGRQGADEIYGNAGSDDLYGGDGNDALFGGDGADKLWGEQGNDTLRGGNGADIYYGGDGDDIIIEDGADASADTVYGGNGNDIVYANGGNDLIYGEAGADILSGQSGDDTIDGGADDDILFGGEGNDILLGGEGNDRLIGGFGADQLHGGDGFDVADYRYLENGVNDTSGVTVDLTTPSGNSGAAAGDSYTSIEGLTGSFGNDILRGTSGADTINGADGNDTIEGRSGDDRLYGGSGADVLTGGDGADQLWGESGNDTLEGGSGDDRLEGGTGDDIIRGGAGNDSIIFNRGDGNDTIDQTGSLSSDRDVLGFSGTIANTNLWFQWIGNDIRVTVLGASGSDGSVQLKDFKTADADQRANISYIIAGDERTKDLAIGSLAETLDRFVSEKGIVRPATQAAFDALYNNTIIKLDGLTFRQHWDNFWAANSAPSVIIDNAAALAAGWQEDERTTAGTAFQLGFRLSDDLESNAVLEKWVKLVAADGSTVEDVSANRLLSNISVTWPVDGSAQGAVSLQGRPGASGTAYLWVHAKDAGGLEVNRWLPVNVAAVADAPTVSASSPGGNGEGAAIALNITANLTDTDGSEQIAYVEISGVPAGFILASNDAAVTAGNNHMGGGIWRVTQAQLAGLKIITPAGWSKDLVGADALRVTAWSREISNGSMAASSIVPVEVRINARPTNIGLSGGSVPENSAAGTVVGVVNVTDPDRLENNKINLAGWGSQAGLPGWSFRSSTETQFIDAVGPDGATVRVLRTGQWDGGTSGEEPTAPGGGVGGTSTFSVDPNKAYKFTIYFKGEDLTKHNLYFGLSANWDSESQSYVEYGNTGGNAQNPYFIAWGTDTKQSLLQQGKWYRAEGYVLPQGHQLVGNNVFGGVFDAQSGARIADTQIFRWNDTMAGTSVSARFFDYYGQAQNGWSTQWYQPAIEELPQLTLTDSAGGRFNLDSRSGLVTVASGAVLDHEAAASRTIGVTATDSGGLTLNKNLTIGVSNVNEVPSLTSGLGWAHFSETGMGGRPANSGAVVATIGVADPDGTTPTLEFAPGSNPHGWFYIDQATKQIRINAGLNFDFEAFKATGQYAINDWNGNGIQEAHVANLYVRASDGSLLSNEGLVQVFIEDTPENPNVPQIQGSNNVVISESIPGTPSTGGMTVATFNLTDPDGPIPNLELVTNPNSWFEVVGNQVRLKPGTNFTAAWNRANGIVHNVNGNGLLESLAATVQVRAKDTSDRYSGVTSFNLYVEDVNEKPSLPTILTQQFHGETIVGSGQSLAGKVIATFNMSDPDGAAPKMKIIGGNGNGWFSVTDSGVLTFTGNTFTSSWIRQNIGQHGIDSAFSGDRDGDGAWELRIASLTMVAEDAHGVQSDPIIYNVYIEDTNEAPWFTSTQFNVQESAPVKMNIGSFGWNDHDPSPIFRNPTFIISGNNAGPMFSISGWDLILEGALNYEGPIKTYYPQISMNDGAHVVGATAQINVEDVNEAPFPSISGSGNWNKSQKKVTLEFAPNDPDDSTGFVVSNVWSDNPMWSISGNYNSTTGKIVITATDSSLDYFGTSFGHMIFTVTDKFGSGLSKTVSWYTHIDGPTVPPGGHIPPVVIDLDGDGIEMIGFGASTVRFDMDGDGDLDKTGWVGADDGFLVLDRNGNGLIDEAIEFSFAIDLEGAQTDLQGLRAYDSNQNGRFDELDDEFGLFQIWRDANLDGVSQQDELKSLAHWGVVSITLQLDETGQTLAGATDNVLFATSEFTRRNGTTGDVGDVFFAYEGNAQSGGMMSQLNSITHAFVDGFDEIVSGAGLRGRGQPQLRFAGLPDGAVHSRLLGQSGSVSSNGVISKTEVPTEPKTGQVPESSRSTAADADRNGAAGAVAAFAASNSSATGQSGNEPATSGRKPTRSNILKSGQADLAGPEGPSDEGTFEVGQSVQNSLLAQISDLAGETPLDRAIRTLSQAQPGSLSLVQRLAQPGKGMVGAGFSAAAPVYGDEKLSRLVAAMASFQSGEAMSPMELRAQGTASAQMADLSAPV